MTASISLITLLVGRYSIDEVKRFYSVGLISKDTVSEYNNITKNIDRGLTDNKEMVILNPSKDIKT